MQFFKLNNSYIRTYLTYSPFLFFLSIISRTFPLFNLFYYLAPVILVIHIFLMIFNYKECDLKLSELLIFFIFPIYSSITSLWSLYPLITLQRSLYLLLLLAGIYSLIMLSTKIGVQQIVKFLFPANIVVLLLSVFSLITGFPEQSWSGGNGLGFMGFSGHQNTLASALLFTLPGVFAYRNDMKFRNNFMDRKINTFEILFILLLSLNIYFIFLTYSRAAMLCLLIGILFFTILSKKKYLIIISLSFIIVLLLSFLLIPSLSETVKDYLFKDDSPLLSRRIVLWEPSYEAAKNGAIIGLGYGVSDPNIKTPLTTGSYFEDKRYIREKGNSILAIIEETGVLGLIFFLLPIWLIVKNRIKALKDQSTKTTHYQLPTTHYSLLISFLIAMFIHAQFEAWWVGPGSVQLPIYLFLMMIAVDIKKRRMNDK